MAQKVPCENCVDPGYCWAANRCHMDMFNEKMGSELNDDYGELEETSELDEVNAIESAVEILKKENGDNTTED